MSIHTSFRFHNANDPAFIKARDSEEDTERAKWEYEHGPIEWTPGPEVRCTEDCIEETDEEYGGWIVDLSKVPKDATHLHISRG